MQHGIHGTLQSGLYVVKIKEMDIMKIGHSDKLHKRLYRLEKSLPFPLELICCIAGSTADEQRLHKYFAVYRRQGEWFDIPTQYRGKLGSLAADCVAILHRKPPHFLIDVQTTSPRLHVVPLRKARENIEQLCRNLPSPFHVRTIAQCLQREGDDGYADIRGYCNTLVRQGYLVRLEPGLYARVDSAQKAL